MDHFPPLDPHISQAGLGLYWTFDPFYFITLCSVFSSANNTYTHCLTRKNSMKDKEEEPTRSLDLIF